MMHVDGERKRSTVCAACDYDCRGIPDAGACPDCGYGRQESQVLHALDAKFLCKPLRQQRLLFIGISAAAAFAIVFGMTYMPAHRWGHWAIRSTSPFYMALLATFLPLCHRTVDAMRVARRIGSLGIVGRAYLLVVAMDAALLAWPWFRWFCFTDLPR
jgi:hypothetical protein